ncbi:MAG: glycosyltransferase family 2 protein, partial [Miltoncostaeaceae bacterium]
TVVPPGGSAAARGRWVAWIDSDLDLDPALLVNFLRLAREGDLDIVVGSKRHPDSRVQYPTRRRIYSWMYQQLVRAMFALNVRDTQVGMKLFRREVLEEVLPVVLVKRFAFDLEMLAVANSFGFDRIAEAPIDLDYRFEGSGVNWRAIAQALWDTGAVFYRLRLLRFYARRRGLARRVAGHRRAAPPTLTILLSPGEPVSDLEAAVVRMRAAAPGSTEVLIAWPGVPDTAPAIPGARTVAVGAGPRPERIARAIEHVGTEVVVLAEHDCHPKDGWAVAALGLLGDPEVGVVVGPVVPRLGGPLLRDAAGILTESRLGVAGTRIRHHVGRLREVSDFPARNMFVRTDALRGALEEGRAVDDQLCAALSGRHGLTVLCSPDVVATSIPPPLWGPYLANMHLRGRLGGRRVEHGQAPRASALGPAGLALMAVAAPRALRAPGRLRRAWLTGAGAYGAVVGGDAAGRMVLHRRPRLALTTAAGAAASHLAFGAGVVRGIGEGWLRRLVRRVRP